MPTCQPGTQNSQRERVPSTRVDWTAASFCLAAVWVVFRCYLFPRFSVSRSRSISAACAQRLQPSPPGEPASGKVQRPAEPEALQLVFEEHLFAVVDRKAYADPGVLMAKFLGHSSRPLPPEVRHAVGAIRSAVPSEECHVEEAILRAAVLDQV